MSVIHKILIATFGILALGAILAIANNADAATLAERKLACETDPVAAKGSECEIVRTWTRCDVEKQALRNKIAKLEKRIKELETLPAPMLPELNQYEYVFNPNVENDDNIKHNILSVYMARDYYKQSTSGSTATVETAYLPGVQYQYEFSFGLVPQLGINVKGHPLFGLGWEF